MKILVTGGAGFIGRHLVESLVKNHTVTIYDNLENSSEDIILSLKELGTCFVKGDILEYDFLKESCRGFDIVIHLAAKSNVIESTLHPEITHKTNVKGTENVLKCCVENKVKKIIFASSAAIYGNSLVPITEKSSINPISSYGKSKLAAENIITEISKKNDMRYVILRMFNVYGKRQNENYSGVITKFLRNAAKDKPLTIYGDGTQTRDFVSIRDVIKAFDSAINSEKSGTYNIASGKSLSINELAKHVLSSLGKKLEIIHLEKQKDDIENSQADITLAKDELGFAPTCLLNDELPSIYHELNLP